MDNPSHRRLLRGLAVILYSLLLALFYWKYVPLVAAYQAVLIPLLLFVAVAAATDVRKGLLGFLFLFPLINNLPYFFKLFDPLPMAPSALVLFLFFFLGRLIHGVFFPFPPEESGKGPKEPLFTPLRLFAGLVLFSALITFWRYTNFFPLWRPRIYELVTNVKGVSAGGAIMSVVFYSLTYLTGIVFFTLCVRVLRTEGFIKKAVAAFGVGSFLSIGFGFIQKFHSPALGNLPASLRHGLLNATFKDALSFGAFLSMLIPFLAGLLPAVKGRTRLTAAVMTAAAGYFLFHAGSKSALIAAAAALLFLGILMLPAILERRGPLARLVIPLGLAAAVFAGASIYLLISGNFPSENGQRTATIERMEDFASALEIRTAGHWRIAGQMIRDYPLSGVGVGAYIIEMANTAKTLKISIGVPESAENLPLHVGSELGIPGMLLFLWILWEMGRRIFLSFRAAPSGTFPRALIAASAAGLFAFLVNSQSHSYIGSYEIQYLFWFLGSLAFAGDVPSPAAAAGRKPSSRRLGRLCGTILLFLGTAGLLWNSAHSLSLNARTERYRLRQGFGLGPYEKDADGRRFRWSGRYAGLTGRAGAPPLKAWLLASHPDIRVRPVRLRLFAAADLATKPVLLQDLVLKENLWKRIELQAPPGFPESSLFLFEVDRTWNPRKAGVSDDPRDLGLAIGIIQAAGPIKPKEKTEAAKPANSPPEKKENS